MTGWSQDGLHGFDAIADRRGLLAALVDDSPVAFQAYATDGRCLFVNRAYLALFGTAPPPAYNLLEDEALERVGFLTLVRRAFAGETQHLPVHWQVRQASPSCPLGPSRFATEVTLIPVRDAGGAVTSIVLCFKDVTAEVQLRSTADALEQSELRFRATFEQAAVGMAHVAPGGTWLEVNQRLCDIVGYTPDELRTRTFQDITYPPDLDADLELVGKVLAGQIDTYSIEKRYVRKDGSLVWIDLTVSLVRDSAGAPQYFIALIQNISIRKEMEARLARAKAQLEDEVVERRRAAEALETSEARFRLLSESGIIGIIIADVLGNIHEANDAFLEIVGFSREDLQGGKVRWSDLTPPEYAPTASHAIEQLRATGVAPPWEKDYVRKDGSRTPVLVGVAMLEDPYCIAFVLDRRPQKRAEDATAHAVSIAQRESVGRALAEHALEQTEEQLRQSQKMEAIGVLAGSVAHDFNNLLSVILGYAEMLVGELQSGDPIRDDVAQIQRAAESAADLTQQLLAFSRRQVLAPKVVSLNAAVSEMTRMLRRIVGEHIELVLLLAPDLGATFVDPNQMQQVLLNLVVNARDAMPRGGKLTIETANVQVGEWDADQIGLLPGRYVVLTVADTGGGMSRETRERIFEPFFTTKPKGEGTGLGLSTVYGILKQSGGSVDVSSEVGSGTTFKIFLPHTHAPAELPGELPLLPGRRGHETVLLVEDDERVRVLARAILKRHGYLVLEAPSGGDALLMGEQFPGPIDVLLTDVVMPLMSGRQLWERLAPLRPAMKVVFMSGYADDALGPHGVLPADLGFVRKPLTPSTLLTTLRQVIEGSASS